MAMLIALVRTPGASPLVRRSSLFVARATPRLGRRLVRPSRAGLSSFPLVRRSRTNTDPRVLAAFEDDEAAPTQHKVFTAPRGASSSSGGEEEDDVDDDFGDGAQTTTTLTRSLRRDETPGDNNNNKEKNRPPTLPAGAFRPKQSLGQNYLSDQNYAQKIAGSVVDFSENGRRVVELGPGLGALTRVLLPSYPDMVAVEIDGRAVELLRDRYAGLAVVHSDVLEIDYTKLATLRGGRLNVIGNLPFYITSQILFTLADHHRAINRAVVTMQWEVAQRLVAKPRTKDYGILSVVFQLYSRPELLFKIPNTAFYPQPKVTSALVALAFPENRPPFPVDEDKLRLVVTTAFRQRRKMLRQSLKGILPSSRGQNDDNTVHQLGAEWATKRPEELHPADFLKLTGSIFGFRDVRALPDDFADSGRPIWRTVGGQGTSSTSAKRRRAAEVDDDDGDAMETSSLASSQPQS